MCGEPRERQLTLARGDKVDQREAFNPGQATGEHIRATVAHIPFRQLPLAVNALRVNIQTTRGTHPRTNRTAPNSSQIKSKQNAE